MSFSHDRRGQSVVIGAVVLFGFLIVALAVYQAFAVPAQNAEIEVDHNENLQSDMAELRNTLLDTRTRTDLDRTAAHRSVQIRLGTRYPSRILTVNPPPATGTLQSQDDVPDVSLESARLADPRFSNVDPILDQSHETSLLTYTPGYNEYREAPRTTFEHSLLYNRFEGANLTLTGQRTVDGDAREIDIIVFDGDVNEQGLRTTLDPATLDGPSQRVPIEGDGEPITLTLPTNSPSMWEEVIDEEPNAEVIDSTSDTVTVELDDGDVWDLRMTRVGADGGEADDLFSSVEGPDDEFDRRFDVVWDRDAIEDTEGIELDGDVFVIDRETAGNQAELNGTVAADGELVDDATVDFSASNSTVTSFADSSIISSDGDFSADLTVPQTGDSRLFAASGDDVDRIEVLVEGESDENMADATEVDNAQTAGAAGSRVSFDLTNTGDDSIIIEAVSLDSTSSSADTVLSTDDEIELSFTNDGSVEQELPIDESEIDLDNTETIAAGDTSTGVFDRFRDGDGPPGQTQVDMSDETVTVTFYFADGTEGTYTLDIS